MASFGSISDVALNSVAFCFLISGGFLKEQLHGRARVRGSCLTRSVNGVAAVRGAANSHSSSSWLSRGFEESNITRGGRLILINV